MSNAKAIVTVIEAVTPEIIAARIAEAEAKVAKAQAWMDSKVDGIVRDLDFLAPEKARSEVAEALQSGANSRDCFYKLRGPQKDLANAMHSANIAKNQKPVKASVIVSVINSYELRGQLKSRGYTYDPSGHSLDFLGMRTMPAWTRKLTPETACAELEALQTLGVTVEGNSILNTVTAQIVAELH